MQTTIQRAHARFMRKNMPVAERIIWNAVRGRKLAGFRFNRQVEIGPYIVDFLCREKKLIVEIDGESHGNDVAELSDQQRTEWLASRGYRVFRTWNFEVYENLDGVLHRLLWILEGNE